MSKPTGRPTSGIDPVQTSLRIERELLANVDAAAAERGVSRTYLINRLVAEGLGRLIPADEIALTKGDSQ